MKKIDAASVWDDLQAIKKSSPLILNITNYVAMEITANSLLAVGASPVMAHAEEEVGELVKKANSLVLNIGTLDASWVSSMQKALQGVDGIPVILDPVAVGATAYRMQIAYQLLKHGVTLVRGNSSEISALCGIQTASKGADSYAKTLDCLMSAKTLASRYNNLVWMSGDVDVVTDGHLQILIHNGHPLMTQATAMGCTATAISGAFLAVNKDYFCAAAHAACAMGVAGELASLRCSGSGSFKIAFIDALYALTLQDLEARLRVHMA